MYANFSIILSHLFENPKCKSMFPDNFRLRVLQAQLVKQFYHNSTILNNFTVNHVVVRTLDIGLNSFAMTHHNRIVHTIYGSFGIVA